MRKKAFAYSLCVAAGLALLAGGCTRTAAGPDSATGSRPVAKAEDAQAQMDSFKAYAEARRLTVRLASEVAGRQIRAILHDHDRNDGRFFDTPAYRRLEVVARDAWPFLRDEWKRMEEQPPGEARNRMKHILESCWRATSEERALGLLADHVLKHRDVFVAKTVQDISRRYEWDWVDSDAGPKECEACVKRFEKWWKRYAPKWSGMMEDRYGEFRGHRPPVPPRA